VSALRGNNAALFSSPLRETPDRNRSSGAKKNAHITSAKKADPVLQPRYLFP